MVPSTIWMIVLVVLVVGEAVTVGLTFIWFAVGALAGLMVAIAGGEVWLQVVVFLVLSGLTLVLVRPLAAKLLKPGYSPTNADRVIGKTALVTEEIDNVEGKGAVKISGQEWTARSEQNQTIAVGTEVRILRIEGVKVFVAPQ